MKTKHPEFDIDGGNLEGAGLGHLVEVVHTSGGLLRDTLDALEVLGVLLVDEIGQVAAIVEDHVEWLTVGEDNSLLNAPDIPGQSDVTCMIRNAISRSEDTDEFYKGDE